MINDFIDLMVTHRIFNEGELFCTTLTFDLSDDKLSKVTGDNMMKDEEAVIQLNKRINEISKLYKDIF